MVTKRKTSTKKKKRIIKKSPKCVYCACINQLFLSIDHKIPLDRDGLDEESNMQTTCILCNRLKGNMDHLEFRKYLKAVTSLREIGMITLEMGRFNVNLKNCPGLEQTKNLKYSEQINKDNENLNRVDK